MKKMRYKDLMKLINSSPLFKAIVDKRVNMLPAFNNDGFKITLKSSKNKDDNTI